jgi:hypothetical protein
MRNQKHNRRDHCSLTVKKYRIGDFRHWICIQGNSSIDRPLNLALEKRIAADQPVRVKILESGNLVCIQIPLQKSQRTEKCKAAHWKWFANGTNEKVRINSLLKFFVPLAGNPSI